MGQQQILLVVLTIILTGIAIAVGIGLFRSHMMMSNQDAIIHDIINIAVNAYTNHLKPESMGGMPETYSGYEIPEGLEENEHASYSLEIAEDGEELTIIGESLIHPGGTIEITFDLKMERVGEIQKYGWVNN